MAEAVDPIEERLERGAQIGFIYFIQVGTTGSIKIGWARNPEKRLATLQTAQRSELILLGVIPGSRIDEKKLHRRYAEHRDRGEWFKRAPIIEAVMKLLMDIGMIAQKCKKSRYSPEQKTRYEFFCCIPEV